MSAIGHASKTIDINCEGTDPVSVAFTCDGKQIVSGERYSSTSRGLFRRFQLGENLNQSAGLLADVWDGFDIGVTSKDGQWVVSIGGKKVVVRNTATNEVVKVDQQDSVVHAIDVSPDSTRFALGLEDKTVRIFSMTGKRLLDPLQHDNTIFGVKFCPHGTRLATATFGGVVWAWDARTGAQLVRSHVDSNFVYGSADTPAQYFSPLGWSNNGQRIFVVSTGRIIAVDLRDTPQWYPKSVPASNEPRFCSRATNGRFIACAAGGTLSFWDTTSSYGQIGPTITFQDSIHSIALSPDDSHLACGRGDKKITVYSLRDILPLHVILDPTTRLPLMSVSDAAFKPWLQHTLPQAVWMLSKDMEGSDYHDPYDPIHHAIANYALVQACIGSWHMAVQHADRSLAMQPSAIGHIAKARGLLGQGQQELAFEAFDLAFRDCKADETRFLLLIKAIFMFISEKREYAIARVNDLITVADDSEKYDYLQVLANMHLMQGNTELTMQSFERAQSLSFFRRGFHLVTILLIFGRSFEELDIIVRRPLRETTTE
ncbi:hypothetical protein JVT61DRAFT_11900 [Boletus reticuloceps]|uniref:WD40 repeat-like protein n=1 Tax=Boletus reticuloceps TaxID=495285 RepID=A0A8I3AEG8_9AGAM|nr:hypothetical protein JVT61DRAFT_11900 [Boletus reticuloceps]